jgi:uncharacterized protein (DUF4415 family)
MTDEKGLMTYAREELEAKRKAGESRTDWARVRAMTEDDLEASIASDPDWADIPRDWFKDAQLVMPVPKKALSLRLDPDIVDWFKQQGPGYQTRINAVLRVFVQQAKKNTKSL